MTRIFADKKARNIRAISEIRGSNSSACIASGAYSFNAHH
jgi:hypothetical protein